jgi:hypothetical protein
MDFLDISNGCVLLRLIFAGGGEDRHWSCGARSGLRN